MYPSRVQSRGGLGSESKVSLGRQCLTVRPPTPWEAVQKGTLLGSTILGSFHSFLSFLSFFFYFVCHGLCSPPFCFSFCPRLISCWMVIPEDICSAALRPRSIQNLFLMVGKHPFRSASQSVNPFLPNNCSAPDRGLRTRVIMVKKSTRAVTIYRLGLLHESPCRTASA